MTDLWKLLALVDLRDGSSSLQRTWQLCEEAHSGRSSSGLRRSLHPMVRTARIIAVLTETKETVAHTYTPTPLNSGGARRQHRCAPG